jgi:hypothetical protein
LNVSFNLHFDDAVIPASGHCLYFLSLLSRFPQVDKSKCDKDIEEYELEDHLKGELLQNEGQIGSVFLKIRGCFQEAKD